MTSNISVERITEKIFKLTLSTFHMKNSNVSNSGSIIDCYFSWVEFYGNQFNNLSFSE